MVVVPAFLDRNPQALGAQFGRRPKLVGASFGEIAPPEAVGDPLDRVVVRLDRPGHQTRGNHGGDGQADTKTHQGVVAGPHPVSPVRRPHRVLLT